MKVLVPVKRVIDPNVRPRVKADGSGVDLANIKMSMNPFCEIAVEEAVRMKEKGVVTEIVLVSIGPAQAQETIRTVSPWAVIAASSSRPTWRLSRSPSPRSSPRRVVEAEQPGLVITGKQAIDDDANQTGQMLAALLDWPQGAFASAVAVEGDKLKVTAKSTAACRPSRSRCRRSSPLTCASTSRAMPRCRTS
jgi:electron transfer flavoprotein beta subunit